jgi:hypothetical protein
MRVDRVGKMIGQDVFLDMGAVVVNRADATFAALCEAPITNATGFPLLGRLTVSFDPSKGGRVRAAGRVPPHGAPHVRLSPLALGGAAWFTLEYDLVPGDLAGLDCIVPSLDAACARKVTVFAVLRIEEGQGGSRDSSSTLIDIGQTRRRHAFPIVLDTIAPDVLRQARRATVIFFIEARDVALDLYGLRLVGLRSIGPHPVEPDDAPRTETAPLRRRLDMAAVAGLGSPVDGPVDGLTAIAEGVFLDIEPGPDRAVAIMTAPAGLQLDFASTAASAWRSLEFRFADVADTGDLMAAIAVAAHTGQGGAVRAMSVLRHYPDDGSGFRDIVLSGEIMIYPHGPALEWVFPLSPHLPDTRARLTD